MHASEWRCVHLIVEECETRLDEEQVEVLLAAVQEHLGTSPAQQQQQKQQQQKQKQQQKQQKQKQKQKQKQQQQEAG